MGRKAPKNTVLCPRCRRNRYTPMDVRGMSERHLAKYPFPALSRLDNKTRICNACGLDEAFADMKGALR